MDVWRAATLVPALGMLAVGSGCVVRPLDGIDAGVSAEPPSAPLMGCGGTVDATGSTPLGAFRAEVVRVTYFRCGPSATVSMESTDKQVLALGATLPFGDGGPSIAPGPISTIATLSAPPSHSILRTTGTLTVDAADVPGVGGGTPGMTGTFALSNDGFSMTGMFSTPYCWVDVCGTE